MKQAELPDVIDLTPEVLAEPCPQIPFFECFQGVPDDTDETLDVSFALSWQWQRILYDDDALIRLALARLVPYQEGLFWAIRNDPSLGGVVFEGSLPPDTTPVQIEAIHRMRVNLGRVLTTADLQSVVGDDGGKHVDD